MKKRLTVAEAKAQFPAAFTDAIGMPDKRIDETMERQITHFLEQGESPYDAKLKTLCIGHAPEHHKPVPPLGAWPKLLYNKEGKTKLAEDEAELKELTKEGWSVTPTAKYADKAQRGAVSRDENIRRLQKELDAETKAKEAEVTAAV